MPRYDYEPIRQAVKRLNLFYGMTDDARKAIYGVTLAPDLVTCSKGVGPDGDGICRHPECVEYEIELTMKRVSR